MTLRTLSDLAGVSIGMLSQVERGITAPSVRSLVRVAEALEVPVGWLFDPPRVVGEGPAWVLRRPHRRSLTLGGEGITKELLAPPGDGMIELLLVTVQPSGSSGPTSYTHAGEDAGVVLEGVMWLEVDGEIATLEAGDAFRFESARPHRFGNSGPGRALGDLGVDAPILLTPRDMAWVTSVILTSPYRAASLAERRVHVVLATP